ncbi:hypothetical protein ACOSP7_012087 [Xanthoceras sorbifolium]
MGGGGGGAPPDIPRAGGGGGTPPDFPGSEGGGGGGATPEIPESGGGGGTAPDIPGGGGGGGGGNDFETVAVKLPQLAATLAQLKTEAFLVDVSIPLQQSLVTSASTSTSQSM